MNPNECRIIVARSVWPTSKPKDLLYPGEAYLKYCFEPRTNQSVLDP